MIIPFEGLTASGYARKLKAAGKNEAEVMAALMAGGKIRKRAKTIVWCVFNRPQTDKVYRPKRYGSRSVPIRMLALHLQVLDVAARARGLSREALMSRLLTVVAEERMVDNVLDDGVRS